MKTYKFGQTTIHLHQNDIPKNIKLTGNSIAIDSETTGLSLVRDRLCLIQLAVSEKECHFVKFDNDFFDKGSKPQELVYLLSKPDIIKKYLGLDLKNLFCTKVSSKLVRTYTDKHGLKDLCKELINIDLNKSSQSSDWSSIELSNEQLKYASHDVIHLFRLKEILEQMLKREKRIELAREIFEFLPVRVKLDLMGWDET